jgi:hypothetical protein
MKLIWNLSYKNKLLTAYLSITFIHVILYHFNNCLVPYIFTNKVARMKGLYPQNNIFFVNGTDAEIINYLNKLP